MQLIEKEVLEEVSGKLKEIIMNKDKLLLYLRDNSPYFPKSCICSSVLLHKYLSDDKTSNWRIMRGEKRFLRNRANFHQWLENDDYVLDMTLFQFYLGANKMKGMTDDDVIFLAYRELQPSVVFNKEHYYKMFEGIKDVTGSFHDINFNVEMNKLNYDGTLDNLLEAAIPALQIKN